MITKMLRRDDRLSLYTKHFNDVLPNLTSNAISSLVKKILCGALQSITKLSIILLKSITILSDISH